MGSKNYQIFFIIALLSILGCCVSCGIPEFVEDQGFYMDTVIQLKIYGKNADRTRDEIFAKIEQIENLMSVSIPESDVSKLNNSAGKGSVSLNSELLYVLDTARKFSNLSNGAFDITVGPLVEAWGICTKTPSVPDPNKIDDLLKYVNFKDLKVDTNHLSASLNKSGQKVDLGGIAKGYAGDVVREICIKNGVKSAFVSLGGTVVTIGEKPDGSMWSIGIQNPRAENGKYIGKVKVSDKVVESSGDYQRYFEKNNVRYHHILNPKTGYPSDSGLISTTIVSKKAIDGDALSTATFVLGLHEGMRLLKSLKDVEGIFITKDKKVYVTEGLKNNFVFSDTSGEFQYVEKR